MKRAMLPQALALMLASLPAWAGEAEEVFQKAKDSVVSIEARDEHGQPESQGSGVVVGPEKVVTNCHVMDEAISLRVRWRDKALVGTPSRRDPERDLCLIAVPGLEAKPMPLRKRADLRVGESAYAVGNPLGLELSVSAGLVSALPPVERTARLYTSAPLSPGSSGGGLFDDRGRLIGITTSIFLYGQNFNTALPADWVEELELRGVPAKAAKPELAPEPDWKAEAEKLEARKDWIGLAKLAEPWLAAYPTSALALVGRGIASSGQGRLDEAILDFRRAIALDPNLAAAQTNLVATLIRQRKSAEALAEIANLHAITHEQDPIAWALQGEAEFNSGHLDAARAAYERATRLNPGSAMIWSWIGFIQFKQNDLAGAEKSLRIALRLRPDDPETRKRLAELQLRLGKGAEAADLLGAQAAANPNDVASWINLGLAEQKRGRLAEAEQAWRKALELDPVSADAWANLGTLQSTLDRLEEAETNLLKAVKSRPNHAHAWSSLAYTQVRRGRLADAEESFRILVELTPRDPQAWLKLGGARFDQGKYLPAATAWKMAVSLAPDLTSGWTNLANARLRAGREDDALEAAQKAIGLDPKDGAALHILATVHGRRGEHDQAIAYLDRAIKQNPGSPESWSGKGYALLKSGRMDEAIKSFETAIRLQRDFANAWINLGEARLRQGKLGQAIQTLEHAAVLAPNALDTRIFLADAFTQLQQPEGTRKHLEQAVRIAPRNTALWRRLVETCVIQGDRSAALKAIAQLERLDPVAAHSLRAHLDDKPAAGRKGGGIKRRN